MNEFDYRIHTLSKIELFDGSLAAITMDDLDALDGLRHELVDKVVRVEDQSLEHPVGWDKACKLLGKLEHTHVNVGLAYTYFQIPIRIN